MIHVVLFPTCSPSICPKLPIHLPKRPAANSVYNCHNPKEIKLITRLRLGLRHLREHKFMVLNPQPTVSPLSIID